MSNRKKWSRAYPQWTVQEEEFFSHVTYFQAQMIRDSFEERGLGKETDQGLAQRLGLPLSVIHLGHLCRLRHLIKAEVTQKELRQLMRHYHSYLEHDQGHDEQEPRAQRYRVHLSSRDIDLLSRG